MSVEPQRETHKFQAEVNQLLNLVIHSLYSHKEIFLRELISNASDALDKLRFKAITQPELLKDDPALEIRILPDTEKNLLIIEDTGIGMSRDELAANLGTIARSGSREFIEELSQAGKKDFQLIGQFGVGFYSAYLVADHVEVVSRAAGEGQQAHRWASDAKGTFTLEPDPWTARGTQVILHLKEDQKEFLEFWRTKELIARYSDYVGHPIKLQGPKDKDGKLPAPEVVNRSSALWQRPRAEITQEQYNEFYKHLTHDFEPPLAHTHFTAEGSQQFTGLLFIPKVPPFDLHSHERKGIRLFVKRVFIMDNCEELLPQWLRFVRGVVDSDDLPLNVSRELLQDSAIVRTIKKQVVKKTLDLLEKIAKDKPDDYKAFWKSFGIVIKEGLAVDGYEYREKLGSLVRYESSRDEGPVSLATYISRMPEGQEAIYYILGETKAAVAGSPHLEALKKRGYEVLYLTDPVDEWAAQGLREFEGKQLVSAMNANLKLSQTEEEKKEKEQQAGTLKPLLDRMQEVLKERVREVRTSDRLTDSPCCLVVPEGGTHAHVERLLREKNQSLPHVKRILEVNPTHPLITNLKTLQEKEPSSEQVKEWIEVLHDQALLTEGSRVDDPNQFARRITDLLSKVASAAVGPSAGTPVAPA